MDARLKAFLLLNACQCFDGRAVEALAQRGIKPEDLLEAPALLKALGASESSISAWSDLQRDGWAEREWEKCLKLKVDVVCFGDGRYPKGLLDLSSPPLLLYLWGASSLDDGGVAVVGTRRPSTYGLRIAKELGRELAAAGFVVVSGGAYGIDCAAQEAALEADGSSIAVLGTGVDCVYPSSNRRLFERLKESGLLVSEYPLSSQARPWRFPKRNRIIAGVSRSVVVVEAPQRSGAMITARIAMEIGRDLWAVPGRVDEEVCRGSNLLIFDGAQPLIDIPAFCSLLGGNVIFEGESQMRELSVEEKLVYSMLKERGERTVDNIASEAKMSAADAMLALGMLTAKGLVASSGPGRWSAIR